MTAQHVTLTCDEYADLLLDADCWRALVASPHVDELLAEWRAWVARQQMSASTAEMAVAVDWRQRAAAPTYAELERRRATYATEPLTPQQIRARAAVSWAALDKQKGVA